jgi:glycosyltransferase involved in cell wall biosynthesis
VSCCDERLRGKRVAMVTFSHYPGDPRPRRAIDALVSQGMQVELICLEDGNNPRREVSGSIDVLRIPLKNRRGGKLAYAYQYSVFILISSLIFAWRTLTKGYDLVYVHNMPDILVVSALAPKLFGAKVILDLHDPMPELMTTIFGLKKESSGVRLISWIEKWSMARADAVLTVNLQCKKIFAARSCSSEKIGVVMNSPDEKIFPFREAQPVARSKEDRNGLFVVMYHGSIVERNGLDLAVEALSRVKETVPAAELRVYGPRTSFLERVMENARTKGLDDSIRYLGPRRLEELVREIEDCDVGVIPNHRNSFTEINTPTRIFEYLSLGKPVIGPRTPGIQDYFNEESLLFFEPGDPESLAKSIEYAFRQPAQLGEIARRGQEVYGEHNWSNERQQLIGIVGNLLGKQLTGDTSANQAEERRMQVSQSQPKARGFRR